MIGLLDKKSPVSSYQPPEKVAQLTSVVQKDYATGDQILTRPWTELNERSIIEDENRGQMMFNGFVDEETENPTEAWKWRGTRSMARNKGIAMHANLTANYLLPLFTAQNDDDQIDRDFSEIMRDIIEWMAMPNNSNYQSSFLQVVFGALTNPVTFLGAEYCEVFQTIREKQKDGSYTTKEIVDQVLSGFHAPIYSSSQILITNPYERNIQKQRSIIKRRKVEKVELEAKYGDHPNWDYVMEGTRSIYNDEDGLFYDIDDNEISTTLVSEETYYDRRHDTEVCFINGIYFGNDDVEHNPIHHRDNRQAPKYNVVPFGYYRIGEHFFYYKSMMNALGWDNMLYDAMSEIVMNRAILEVEMPIAVSGTTKIDSEIIFPSSVVTFEDKDTKISPLMPSSNLVAGFNALRETEKSLTEGSVSETVSGQLPEASQKAFSVAQAQANSKKLISGVGKSIAESVMLYGDLMKDIAINNITVPEVDMLTSGTMKLKYRTFLLPNKSLYGGATNKKIEFDSNLIGSEMTTKEKQYAEARLLEASGYPEKRETIVKVNPEMFAKFYYFSRVDVEEMFAKNQEYWQTITLNLVQTLQNNPFIDQEGLLRRLMYSFYQSDGEELVKKADAVTPTIGQPNNPNPLGAITQAKQLGSVASSAMIS